MKNLRQINGCESVWHEQSLSVGLQSIKWLINLESEEFKTD